jgi:D-sedoheptulose 7-phosphate isomerase
VIKAIETARRQGLVTVGLAGGSGGRLLQSAELCLCMPSAEVPRIQEAHALVGHILCELVENALFTDA